MRSAYIYALKDPRNNKFRYIGKTICLCNRYDQHLQDKTGTRKSRWIQKRLSLKLKPSLIILDICGEDGWQKKEICWISRYKEETFNHTPGGEGVTKWEEESLRKLSNSQKRLYEDTDFRRHRRQITSDPVRRKKISVALKGRPKSPEHVAKLPQNQKGYKHKLGFSEKISRSIRRRYEEGYVLPEATKQRLRKRMLGNRLGLGNKSRTGQKQSEEERHKKSETLKGRTFSKDTLQKMSVARRNYWRRRKGERK